MLLFLLELRRCGAPVIGVYVAHFAVAHNLSNFIIILKCERIFLVDVPAKIFG